MNNEANEIISDEPSRLVKIMMVKYKCALLLTILILACLQVAYMVFNQMNETGKIDRLFDIYEHSRLFDMYGSNLDIENVVNDTLSSLY